MSIREPQQQHDEFDAFLHGEGELASMLRDLPQLAPPPSLDAAIRADAERAVERSRAPLPVAANDAVVPESARIRQPSFATRWSVPLALVASAVIAAPLFMLRLHAPIERKPINQAHAGQEMTIVMPRILPSHENVKPRSEAAAFPFPNVQVKVQPAYIPPPVLAAPEAASPQSHEETASNSKTAKEAGVSEH